MPTDNKDTYVPMTPAEAQASYTKSFKYKPGDLPTPIEAKDAAEGYGAAFKYQPGELPPTTTNEDATTGAQLAHSGPVADPETLSILTRASIPEQRRTAKLHTKK